MSTWLSDWIKIGPKFTWAKGGWAVWSQNSGPSAIKARSATLETSFVHFWEIFVFFWPFSNQSQECSIINHFSAFLGDSCIFLVHICHLPLVCSGIFHHLESKAGKWGGAADCERNSSHVNIKRPEYQQGHYICKTLGSLCTLLCMELPNSYFSWICKI